MGDRGYEDLGFAKPDTQRLSRTGFGEVIFCEGKTPEQTAIIASRLVLSQGSVLCTRASAAHFEAVRQVHEEAYYDAIAACIVCGKASAPQRVGKVAVVSAGTSDQRVAAEALCTLHYLGHKTEIIADCGVAGIHRVIAHYASLEECDAVIVVAGMEGALPSVVGGLTGRPVVAVPTSIGYGASFQGLAALLGMLNSCAAGVVVVNIDNGFGAAMAVARLLRSR